MQVPTSAIINGEFADKYGKRGSQPRAWLDHIPYLRATQTLRLRCRVCAVRTHAVFVVTE